MMSDSSVRLLSLILVGVLAGVAHEGHAQEAPAQAPTLAPAPRFLSLRELDAPAGPRVSAAIAPLDTSDREAVRSLYNNVLVPALAVTPEWTGSVVGCTAGGTSIAYATATMDAVNFFRAMTGLPSAIPHNPVKDGKAQAAALMMSANNNLSHFPPATWACYSAAGAEAAGRSNIALGAGGARAVTLYIEDSGAHNVSLGHRRWILYPRQSEMGTGSTANANALWVVGEFGSRAAGPEFVAWPTAGYVPHLLLYPRWSFAVNTDADVVLTNATVTVSRNGTVLPITPLPQSVGYGDDTIAWELDPVSLAIGGSDVVFTVQVKDVLVEGVPKTYLYHVIAFDPSVSTTTDSDLDGLSDLWERSFGLDPHSATGQHGATGDPDGDGKTNLQEQEQETHPRGAVTRYFAEGATGPFFTTRLALFNPGDTENRVNLRFLRPSAPPVSEVISLPPRGRRTLDVGTVAGLVDTAFATVVEAEAAVIADRTMSWDRTGYGSHAETSAPEPSRSWYLAEGATHSGFALFYLLQNPSEKATVVRVRFLRTSGAPLVKEYTLPAQSRTNIWVNVEEFPGLGQALASAEVSAAIESLDQTPIIVERAMYRSNQGRTFNAGHESMGVSTPSTRWFLAEGRTGPWFDEFILIANPGTTDASVRVTYLLASGETYTKTMTAPANARSGIWVDYEEIPGVAGHPLHDVALSTTVESLNDVPLVVERAMWWPGDGQSWYEAHNSSGAVETGARWGLAEGESGGPTNVQTYVLIANTSAHSGRARVTLYGEDGTSQSKDYELLPNSRINAAIGPDFGSVVDGRRFGTIVEALATTDNGPVPELVVERAMYWDAGGVPLAAGTNARAVKLEPAQAAQGLAVNVPDNPTAPLWMETEKDGRYVIQLYGTRDVSGNPNIPTGVALRDKQTSLDAFIGFAATGDPETISASDGSFFARIVWPTPSRAELHIRTFSNQPYIVALDLGGVSAPVVEGASVLASTSATSAGVARTAVISLNTNGCGVPSNSIVKLLMAGAYALPTTQVGPTTFEARLPDLSATPLRDINTFCENVPSRYEIGGQSLSRLLAGLASSLALACPQLVDPRLVVPCQGVASLLGVAAAAMPTIKTACGAARVLEWLGTDFVDAQPAGSFNGLSAFSSVYQIPRSGPVPEMALSLPGGAACGPVTYKDTFIVNSHVASGWSHTYTITATATFGVPSPTVALKVAVLAVSDTPNPHSPATVEARDCAVIPLTTSGNQFSGSVIGQCWGNLEFQISGTRSASSASGTFRIHNVLIPPWTQPAIYNEDSGHVPFTLSRR
jgi:hypothetical protein